jgi:tetratricopeptide (TPR) repeat protein
MRRIATLIVLVGLVAALVALRPWQTWQYMFGGDVAPLTSPWKTENEWLAGEILRDTAEMAAAAADRRAFGAHPPVVTIDVRPGAEFGLRARFRFGDARVEQDVPIRRCIWCPDDYAPWVSAVLAQLHLSAGRPSADPRLMADLLDLHPARIEEVNQRVSTRLERSLLDSAAHEDAALVLARFALREAAGVFSDQRPTLNRIAAHLAMARALRHGEPAGPSGRVAEAALLVFIGRGLDAALAIEGLSTSDPAAELPAWARVLLLRLNEDWRVPAGDFGLERAEHVRARAATVSVAQALSEIDEEQQDETTDWGRIAITAGSSVELGWRFAQPGIEAELAELEQVTGRTLRPLAGPDLARQLDAPEERCLTAAGVRVLSFGSWAQAFQRHAARLLVFRDHHLRASLALPKEADRAKAEDDRRLGNLWIFPLAVVNRAWNADNMDFDLAGAVTLAVQHPERVAANPWWQLEQVVPRDKAPHARPRLVAWMSTGLPLGTAYDAAGRSRALGLLPGNTSSIAAALVLMPQSFAVAWLESKQHPQRYAALDDLRHLFGARTQYDVRVLDLMVELVRKDDTQCLPLRASLCDLDPERCLSYGADLVEAGRDSEAVKAYERAVREAQDHVDVSNHVNWLVEYYETHGQPEQALKVAQDAAAVNSGGGLATMGRLFELRRHFAVAEEWYIKERDRYENVSLAGFYYRAGVLGRDPAYAKQFADLSVKLFPDGLARVALGDLNAPPPDGAVFRGSNFRLERAGLGNGDVAVALDGFRVHSLEQYDFVRALSESPQLRLIAWRRGRGYFEVQTRVVGRRFGVELVTYKSPGV